MTIDKTTCQCGCETCKTGEYRCGDGVCISNEKRCDGIIDCINDEVGCGEYILVSDNNFAVHS